MLIDLALQPKQIQLGQLFEAKGSDVPTIIGFGGARGGAKSGGARRLMLGRRLTHPGTAGFIVRRNYTDLYENYIIKYQEEQPWMDPYYNAQHKEYTLPNGSRIAFKFADTTNEVRKLSRGPEAMDVLVDQAEQFTEQELVWLQTPNRWPGVPRSMCKWAAFFNPGGPGTEYLRRIFHLKKYQAQERSTDYAFIQAYGWDNFEWFRGQVDISEADFYDLPHDQRFNLFITETQYGRKLNSLPPSLRVGELLGSFDSFSGQYYAGVWDENTSVITPSEADQLIQPWWTRWTSTDWGFAHHACHLWFASGKLNPDQFKKFTGNETEWPVEVVVCYREFIASETAEDDLARKMINMTPPSERPLIRAHWLSPDAWAKRGSANTVADQMTQPLRDAGLPAPEQADNDRIGGWRLLYQGFKQSGAFRSPGTRVTQEMAKVGPMLVISSACAEVLSAVPLLIRDEDELEDVLKTPSLADDVADSLRYGYKSQIDPRSKAPRDVRAKEVYDSFVGNTSEVATNRAIAMKRFAEQERKTTRVGRPRWR